MPAEVFFDTWDVLSPQVVPVLPSADGGTPCYPYPGLALGDQQRQMTLRVAVLRNAFLEATFCVDLGGRLVGLRDVRTGLDIVARPESLALRTGSERGVELEFGIQILAGDLSRTNALGSVEYSAEEPDDDSAAAAVLFHELVAGVPLGWQARWSLAADAPELRLDFALQRRDVGLDDAMPSSLSGLDFEGFGELFWQPGGALARRGAHGVGIFYEPGAFDGVWEGRLLRRWAWHQDLAPRQVDRWSVVFVPYSDMPAIPVVAREGALAATAAGLRLAAHGSIEGSKLLVKLTNGQVLEAPAVATPDHAQIMGFTGLPGDVQTVVWRSADRTDIAVLELDRTPPEATGEHPELGDETDPRLATREGSRAGAAWVQQAHSALRAGDPARANALLEQAISVNAEDPLLWWLKAVVARLLDPQIGEREELLNAHFLSPLEPALRAEAFLQQTAEMGKEANPLLKPLAANPDAALEVVHLLMEAGLMQDATRLIDELLRHGEQPMLRYLHAANLLEQTRMEVEAAEQVRKAESVPLGPPYAWRTHEIRAIAHLHAAYPTSVRLAQLAALAEKFNQENPK